jgi:hypothetical protein
MMGGIYEVRRLDGLRCHNVHTKVYEDWLEHSKVDRGDTQTHRQHGDRISLLLFFQIRKVGYKGGEGKEEGKKKTEEEKIKEGRNVRWRESGRMKGGKKEKQKNRRSIIRK